MSKANYSIRKVAVIGSGTMGASIAGLLAGTGFSVLLLDTVPTSLNDDEKYLGLSLSDSAVRNRIVNNNLVKVRRQDSKVFFVEDHVDMIETGNLEDDFSRLSEVDWIIEAVVEDLEIKKEVFTAIDKIRSDSQIVSTNTSGFQIGDLCKHCSREFRTHFLGIHFFNPPRHLKLLEIIPNEDTDARLVEFFLTRISQRLGKHPVVCEDTPGFIANRIGLANNFWRINYALNNSYSIEEIDTICGPLIGSPNTAVFRLMDLIGIDVAYMIGRNSANRIPGDEAGLDSEDSIGQIFAELVKLNWVGNKTGVGFYKTVLNKDGRNEFWPINFDTMEHEKPSLVEYESVRAIKKIKNLDDRLKAWFAFDDRAAEYVLHSFAFMFSYVSKCSEKIANDLWSIDCAMRFGYMMDYGPFEIWDILGVKDTLEFVESYGYDIGSWVYKMIEDGNCSFYRGEPGSREYYDWHSHKYKSISVQNKSTFFKKSNVGFDIKILESNKTSRLIDIGSGVLQLEFTGKVNSIGLSDLEMIQNSIRYLESSNDVLGIVIANNGKMFSAGADLHYLIQHISSAKSSNLIEKFIVEFQDSLDLIRYCTKPVVVAPFNYALGGGAELAMSCHQIVAHVELYMGLVEVGAGLVPAGGGCKEILRRVVSSSMRIAADVDALPFVRHVFMTLMTSTVSSSAFDAKKIGYINEADHIVLDRKQLLNEAKASVIHMSTGNYRPPIREKIYIGGENIYSILLADIYQLHKAGNFTEHDTKIGKKLAWILCGGGIIESQWVDEQYIYELERQVFTELICMDKTIDRIKHVLATGKVLRN